MDDCLYLLIWLKPKDSFLLRFHELKLVASYKTLAVTFKNLVASYENIEKMRYIALLRGINVGGHNKIKMESLREMFSALGFDNVKSYINSGNVAFDTRKSDNIKLASKIAEAIEKEFTLAIKVLVRSKPEIEDIVENNPFEGRFENDKDLHVFFLDEIMPPEKCESLLSQANTNEMIAIRNLEIFCLLRVSVLDSLIGKGFIDKKLKVPTTARNWRTVKKIAEL